MSEILKILTIANIVAQIIQNFLNAGGPSFQPSTIANEASKEIQRKVATGYLPADVLDGHEQIIQQSLCYHPLIANDSVAAVLDDKRKKDESTAGFLDKK